jgi:Mn-dependent DtxR family transcriptional regulator
MSATRSMEDYLERIYDLMLEKGYARVSDIAVSMDVTPPSVSRMLKKLSDEQFIHYEKYRGLTLTQKGERIGQQIKARHDALDQFLRLLGIVDQAVIDKDIEGIEHHVSPETLDCITKLVSFFAGNPETRAAFREHHDNTKTDGQTR